MTVQVFMMSSQEFSTMLGKRKLPKPKRSAMIMDKIIAILTKRLEQYAGSVEVRTMQFVCMNSGEKSVSVECCRFIGLGWVGLD